MAIAYKSAGAGAGTDTSAASLDLPCPASVDANDILIAHVSYQSLAADPTTPSGWTALYGPTTLGTGTTPTARAWVYGKIADGSEDGATIGFGTAGGTAGRSGRIYSFSGYTSGTIRELCVGFNNQPSEGSIPLPAVTTYSAGALAVALLCQDDNNAYAAAGAVTGGTWAEPVAEYSDAAIGTQGSSCAIQTSTPTADPGTISGGTANATADEGSSIGLSIHASPPSGLHLVMTATAFYHSSTTTPKDTSEILHWLDGDLIIAVGVVGDESSTLDAPTATGLSFAQEAFTSNGGGNFSDVWIWSDTTAADGDQLLNMVRSGGGSVFGHAASIWRNHDGVGNTATGTSTTQTLSLTRSEDNSAVMWGGGDWSGSGAAATFTPTGPVAYVLYSQGDGSALGSHVGVWESQGAAGSTSYGVSSASTGSFAKAAVEILAGAGTTDATVTAVVIATSTALPAPAISTGQVVTATAIATTTALPAPAITAVTAVSPAAIVTTTALPAPALATGQTVTPPVVATTTALPAPAVSTDQTVAATVVATTTALPAPTVSTGSNATVTPAVIATVTALPAPAVATDQTVTATVIATVAALPAPSVSVGSNATITPAAIATVTALPAPSVATGSTVTPATVATVVALPAPVVSGSAEVTAAAIATVTALPAPAVSGGATVTAGVIATVTALPVPTVEGNSGTGIKGNAYPPDRAATGNAYPRSDGGIIGSVA